jgi:hypothetical protein
VRHCCKYHDRLLGANSRDTEDHTQDPNIARPDMTINTAETIKTMQARSAHAQTNSRNSSRADSNGKPAANHNPLSATTTSKYHQEQTAHRLASSCSNNTSNRRDKMTRAHHGRAPADAHLAAAPTFQPAASHHEQFAANNAQQTMQQPQQEVWTSTEDLFWVSSLALARFFCLSRAAGPAPSLGLAAVSSQRLGFVDLFSFLPIVRAQGLSRLGPARRGLARVRSSAVGGDRCIVGARRQPIVITIESRPGRSRALAFE